MVTTPVGSEGMGWEMSNKDADEDDPRSTKDNYDDSDGGGDWGGKVSWDASSFVHDAVSLYNDEGEWGRASKRGREIQKSLYRCAFSSLLLPSSPLLPSLLSLLAMM